jgi:hypothetical protein
MTIAAYEGVVENSRVQLPAGVCLPEKAKVYVVVPEVTIDIGSIGPAAHIRSPRLVHPENARDFVQEVLPENKEVGS